MGKKKLLFIPLLILFVSIICLLSERSDIQACDGCEEKKVTICHATSSQQNPYNQISVDKNSTVQGHDDHIGDIIPTFVYMERRCVGQAQAEICMEFPVLYPGKNWDAQGQEIYRNGCEIPYKQCSETVTKYGDWSKWMDDPNDVTQEMRVRRYVDFDAKDNKIRCDEGRDVEYRYKECSRTVRVTRGWSEWKDDVNDETQELRKKIVYIMDSRDNTVQCADPVDVFEYRYKECSRTVRRFDEWSMWMDDPLDSKLEYRERDAYAVDSQNSEVICVGPVIETETRDKEVVYEQCEYTTEIYGDWSEWVVDPGDDTREFRERIISIVDSEYSEISCGENKETEYRDIEEDGDVLGTSDVAEVKGTSIVYVDTAGGTDLLLIQYALMILTGMGFIFVGSKYLTM